MTLIKEWSNVLTFMQDVSAPNRTNPYNNCSHTTEPSASWDMGVDWDNSIRMGREGWPDGTARLQEMTANVLSSMKTADANALDFIQDVTGAIPDIAAFVAGEPEDMINPVLVPKPTQVIRIGITTTSSGGVDAQVHFIRGAAVAILTQALEAAGYMVEVSRYMSNASGYTGKLTVKHPGEPLEMDRLAYFVAHPAAYRRLGFAEQELFTTKGSPYSAPTDPDKNELDTLQVYIPKAGGWEKEWLSPDSAAQWVMEKLDGILVGN